jgi:hypothetical protein
MKPFQRYFLIFFLILACFATSLETIAEITLIDAESIWNVDFFSPSPDVTDSTDASILIRQTFVSHAESVWHSELNLTSQDVLDSTDAPEQRLVKWAFVSHGESVWNISPEKPDWVKPEKWSFAIITDLHIGWGIPDYNDESYNDKEIGQNYYLTERLEKAIQWINENYKNPDYNIKFVVVDGDISDTAEYSEFLTARNILNQLEIPYIPIIGNHDIWPYIQKSTCNPDGMGGRWNTILHQRWEEYLAKMKMCLLLTSPVLVEQCKEEAKKLIKDEPLGDEYFETVFWKDNSTNTQKIETLFGKFERQEEKEGYQGSPYFQNYIFDYGGVTFIALDFVSREYENLIPPGSLTTDLNEPTLKWFESSVESGGDKKIIVFTHQPIKSWRGYWLVEESPIKEIINKCNCTIFDFAGHTHVNGVPVDEEKINESEFSVIETEALLQSKNPEVAQLLIGMPPAPTGEFIRIIQIKNKENQDVNYGILINGFPKAVNPYITTNKEELAVGESITFYSHSKNLKPEEILSYDWDFDRNYSSQCVSPEDKYSQCIVTYNQPGTYKVSLKVIPKSDPSYSEEISWNLKVKEKVKPRWKLFLPTPGIIPLLNGEEDVILTEQDNAQNTPEWVLITKVASPAKPIGAFEVHFENANQDIDLSNLVADINLDTKKSILYMPEWPKEIENSKVLFLPISK